MYRLVVTLSHSTNACALTVDQIVVVIAVSAKQSVHSALCRWCSRRWETRAEKGRTWFHMQGIKGTWQKDAQDNGRELRRAM